MCKKIELTPTNWRNKVTSLNHGTTHLFINDALSSVEFKILLKSLKYTPNITHLFINAGKQDKGIFPMIETFFGQMRGDHRKNYMQTASLKRVHLKKLKMVYASVFNCEDLMSLLHVLESHVTIKKMHIKTNFRHGDNLSPITWKSNLKIKHLVLENVCQPDTLLRLYHDTEHISFLPFYEDGTSFETMKALNKLKTLSVLLDESSSSNIHGFVRLNNSLERIDFIMHDNKFGNHIPFEPEEMYERLSSLFQPENLKIITFSFDDNSVMFHFNRENIFKVKVFCNDKNYLQYAEWLKELNIEELSITNSLLKNLNYCGLYELKTDN
jgi:hypothetical protein